MHHAITDPVRKKVGPTEFWTSDFNAVKSLLRPDTRGCIPSGRDCVPQCLNPYTEQHKLYITLGCHMANSRLVLAKRRAGAACQKLQFNILL